MFCNARKINAGIVRMHKRQNPIEIGMSRIINFDSSQNTSVGNLSIEIWSQNVLSFYKSANKKNLY